MAPGFRSQHDRLALRAGRVELGVGHLGRAAPSASGAAEMSAAGLDPRTPVLIGVGQAWLEDPGYAGFSPIALAVQAARAAVADSSKC